MQQPEAADRNFPGEFERLILERYGPACVIVKENGEAVYFSSRSSLYLRPPGGSLENNVVNLVNDGLRVTLRAALLEASTRHERVVRKQFIVEPLTSLKTQLYLILFEEEAPGPGDAGSEESIRHLERERLAAIVDSSDDAIVSKDLDGIIRSWNRGAERIFGYPAAEVIGKPISILIPLEQANDMPTILARISRGESVDHFETQRITKDGRTVLVSLTISPIVDRAGRVIGASEIARNFTERQQTEALMVSQKQAFEMFTAGTPMMEVLECFAGEIESHSRPGAALAIHLLDESGTRFEQTAAPSLSPDYCRAIDGMEISSAIGPCCAAVTARQRVVVADLAASREFPDFAAFALPLGIRSGWSTPILDSTGNVLGTVAEYYRAPRAPQPQDDLFGEIVARTAAIIIERNEVVNDLRRAQEQLRRAVAFDDAVLANMSEGLYTVDAGGLVTSMNPAAERMFGYSFDELRGRKMHEMTHHHHADGTPFCAEDGAGLQAFQPGTALIDRELVFIRKDGTVFDVVYSSSPLRAGGEISGLVVVFRDISGRKRAEAELLHSEESLRRLNEDLKHFSYAVSHDLQEPLRMVMSFTQLLGRQYKGKLDPQADEYIAHAVSGAQRMEDLLKDLREYWSVAEQKIENLMPVDCNRVLEKAVEHLDRAIQETRAVITSDHLPTLIAEELSLTLLFQNLIGNAIKYHRPDAPPLIHLSAQQNAGGWKISVTDNGIGIEAQHLETIFAPFKRLHGREYPGTGIGLAMCQKIVERYRGRIWAESTSGEGSTFYFTVPAP